MLAVVMDGESCRMAQATAAEQALPAPQDFQTVQVLTITGGHLIHDIFPSFVAPLMPLIIQKLNLTLALAGSLVAFQQFPSLINPFMGLLADRISLRWFAILAPTITAIAMSLIGVAPSYTVLVILLLVAGLSTAAWHVPAPVMIKRVSGRRVGQGMSFFMVGGELAYAIGPLLAVAAVSWWTLEGTWRLMPLGAAASVLLYWRLRDADARPADNGNGSWGESWREMRRVVLPIVGIIGTQGFMSAALTTYLPTFLSKEGSSLWQAGIAYSIMQAAATVGVLVTGTLSDRLGRRRVLASFLIAGPAVMLLFLTAQGWLVFPILIVLGMVGLTTNPVLMALVQEHSRDHPATGNGIYMALSFAGRSLIVIAVGAMADQWGLRAAFYVCALLSFASAPFVLLLPKRTTADEALHDQPHPA